MSAHSAREKQVMLWICTNYPSVRVWRFDSGEAYAKFSVKGALEVYKKTKSITQALKVLATIKYGHDGWPDLFVMGHGKSFGVEIKVGRDKQRDSQIDMQATFERMNFGYILWDDKKSFEEQLKAPLDWMTSNA